MHFFPLQLQISYIDRMSKSTARELLPYAATPDMSMLCTVCDSYTPLSCMECGAHVCKMHFYEHSCRA